MKISKLKYLLISLVIILISSLLYQCGDNNTVEPESPAVIQIVVKSAADSSVISGANVVLYNANSGESISRIFSGNDGVAGFESSMGGNFYVRISAQDFREVPEGSISPVPFTASTNQTITRTYYMNELFGTFGKIDGKVSPNLPGFLVVATLTGMNTEYHTYSGPDGYFVLFNVPYGTYDVDAIKSGYQSANQPQVTLSSGSTS